MQLKRINATNPVSMPATRPKKQIQALPLSILNLVPSNRDIFFSFQNKEATQI